MNKIIAHAGTVAALLLLAVSAFMNLRYGMSLARSDVDRAIFAAASLGADAMKALAPFYIWAMWQARRWIVAGAASALWLVCAAYALSSALGFAALSRAEVVGTTTGKQETLIGQRGDLARKEAQRSALALQEPSRVLALRRDAQKQVWRWAASKECRDITLKETRAYCDGIASLDQQLAKAEAAEKLDAEIAALRIEIAALSGVGSLDRGDPQAGLISHLSGFKFEIVQTGLVLLAIVLVELGSGLGLFVVSRYAEIERHLTVGSNAAGAARPVVGDVAAFVLAETEESPSGSLTLTMLRGEYEKWCRRQGAKSLAEADFARAFQDLAHDVGYVIGPQNGAVMCTGLVLASHMQPPDAGGAEVPL